MSIWRGMKLLQVVAVGALCWGGWQETAFAECRVLSTAPTYEAGKLKDLTCDTAGNLQIGVNGATGGLGTATALPPTRTEGSGVGFSFDLDGNARVVIPLQAGQDQSNNLVMVSGGAVRGVVGNVASGLLVGADCTSHCTPAKYVALPKGSKTFTSTLVSSTSGAATVAQVHKIYGANTNTFTDDDAVLLCTITFTSATQYLLKAFTQACAPVTGDWLYYGVISSGTTGTATVTGAVTATY